MEKNNWERALTFVAGFIIIWLLIERRNKNIQIQDLNKALESSEAITNDVKKKIQELISNNPDIEEGMCNELGSIAALIEIKEETKAILGLAKIIESLLKKIYKGSQPLKNHLSSVNKKTATFHDYLELAVKENVISKEDYHLVSILKIIRNEEAHELNVKKEKGKLLACFITGLTITLSLHNLIKHKTQKLSLVE